MVSLQEDSQKEDVCPICQEHPKEAVRTDCKHVFCQVCLAQHMEKALACGALCCPLCRKPYSEEILGKGYICHKHQKRFQRFCEKSKCLLCVECLKSPEHQSHSEPTIENAVSHYKERLNRRCRKLRKDIGELQRLKAQEEEKLQALQFHVDCGNCSLEAKLVSQNRNKGHLDILPQEQLGQLEDTSAEETRILDLSKAITQISLLVTDLESTAKELDANTLMNASDLLERYEPSLLSPRMCRPMT